MRDQGTRLPPAALARIGQNLGAFVRHLNARRYRDALLAMEACWFEDRSDFHQGLVQLCNALNQMQFGLTNGPQFMLRRARERLQKFSPAHQGLAINEILLFIEECERLIGKGLSGPIEPPEFTLRIEHSP